MGVFRRRTEKRERYRAVDEGSDTLEAQRLLREHHPSAEIEEGNRTAFGADSQAEQQSSWDPEAILGGLSAAFGARSVDKLRSAIAALVDMTITPYEEALREMDEHNVRSRELWGVQAVDVPIYQCSRREAEWILLNCLSEDYWPGGATELRVEGLSAETSTSSLPADPALAQYYQKRLEKHRDKKARQSPQQFPSRPIRKWSMKTLFEETFGSHEVLRVDEDSYLVMPCCAR